MKRLLAAAAAAWLSSLGLFAQSPQARPVAPPAESPASTQTVKQDCAGCHSDRGKAGGLSLADFDVSRPRPSILRPPRRSSASCAWA